MLGPRGEAINGPATLVEQELEFDRLTEQALYLSCKPRAAHHEGAPLGRERVLPVAESSC